MGVFTAIILLLIAIGLFVTVKKKIISNETLVVLANIAGVVALLAAILVFVVPAAESKSPLSTSSQESATIALSDNFDNGVGGYDTSLWQCESECDVENIVTNNGVLNLKRDNEGWSALFSKYSWSYNDLDTLEGKVEISSKSNMSVGVLGISWYETNGAYGQASCDINDGYGAPYILCYFGLQSDREYITNIFSVSPDTWYTIQIKFDKKTQAVKYYVDNSIIGEYTARVNPEIVKAQMGIYSQNGVNNGLVYIDDVKLTLTK